MSILSGFLKTKKHRKMADGNYQLQSEWTSSETVEMADGNTAETNLGAIKGITSSLASTSTNYALSSSAGKDLQDQITQLNTDLSTKANAADLITKASTADLNAEKATRENVDASLQSQINDTKSVASFEFVTIISTVAEFSDGYLNKKDGVVYFSFEFKIINITNGVTTNIASIPYKPYGICHCSATLYNGNTSFPVFSAINDGIIQVHLPSDCVLSSDKANNKLRFSGSFPAKN